MPSDEIFCSLLAYLISKHAYGSPISKEQTVNLAGIPVHKHDEAKEAFEELRTRRFITDQGGRGIELNNSEFGALADFLYHRCGWNKMKLKSRLRHYEGWGTHDWF